MSIGLVLDTRAQVDKLKNQDNYLPDKIYMWKVVIFLAFVKIREGESFEGAFRRFKKSCEKSGVLSEVKKREYYEKPSIRKKKKSIAAQKRAKKKTRKFEA